MYCWFQLWLVKISFKLILGRCWGSSRQRLFLIKHERLDFKPKAALGNETAFCKKDPIIVKTSECSQYFCKLSHFFCSPQQSSWVVRNLKERHLFSLVFKRVFQCMSPKPLTQSCPKPVSLPGPTIQDLELSFCSFLSNSGHKHSSKAQ